MTNWELMFLIICLLGWGTGLGLFMNGGNNHFKGLKDLHNIVVFIILSIIWLAIYFVIPIFVRLK